MKSFKEAISPYIISIDSKIKRVTFMTHSYKIHFFHFIWSTKARYPFISKDIESRLYPYIGSIIKNHRGDLLDIGGLPDHIHLLVQMSSLDKFSFFIRDIKAYSSQWIHKTYPDLSTFAWQEGYASFSVSYSSLDALRSYIRNQKKHHETMTFEEEYLKFLKFHDVKYDDRFLFG